VSEREITLHISENGDDTNEGSLEGPLWSVAAALDKVRWKSCRAATFVIHGSITEIAAHSAMIDITGRGLPAISLRGESPESPGRLNAAGLNKRVIYVSDGNILYLENDIVLCGGLVRGSGGSGVTLENATLVMRGGEISGNDSGLGMGGGVYVGKDSEFVMEGGLIRGNTTLMHGGGVFPDEGGTFTMSGGTISGNTAHLCGGGVFVGIGSKFEMTGGCIDGNISGTENTMLLGGIPIPLGRGGGVYVSRGTSFRMEGGEIVNNRAIAVQMDDSSAGSGGGVFVEQGGIFYFEKGKIRKNGAINWGGGVYSEGSIASLQQDCVISNNVARLGGGGVQTAGERADFTMRGGFLLDNFTAGNGGGINIIARSSFTMEGGLIAYNDALKLGNALAIEGTALMRGGVVLSVVDERGGKNTGLAEGSGEGEPTDADTEAGAPDKAAKTVGIFISDAGKLTLRGGELEGRIIMEDKGRLEDLRETGPRETAQKVT
jgi:hypothetical protein